MLNALLVGTAACASAGLGCLQAINVVRGRRLAALCTSIAQSGAALTLYKIVPAAQTADAIVAFIAGSALGGQISMYVTRSRGAPPSLRS